ncbi:MAG: hypothetical protein EOP20_05010 [Hyphomicrobiales bacterium]|nr:MAG: hypothetical protein EOP20_05010 [Hyphomicrobiales bacterium]
MIVVIAVALVGCNAQAPSAGAPTAVAPLQAPTETGAREASPEIIVDASIVELDPAVLAGATWTAKACALTSEENAREITARRGQPLVMEGYVVDPSDAPAGGFDVVLKGDKQFRIPAHTGRSRPDVAAFFKVPALAEAGYLFSTTFGAVPPGTYAVDFMLERAGIKYFCESGKTLVLQ